MKSSSSLTSTRKPRRKRVVFEEAAVQLSQKHEAAPTALKPPKEFQETVRFDSTGAWDKVTLASFRVTFDGTKPSKLRGFIAPEYFDHPTEDNEFYEGYVGLISALEDASEKCEPWPCDFDSNPSNTLDTILRGRSSRSVSPNKRVKLSHCDNKDAENLVPIKVIYEASRAQDRFIGAIVEKIWMSRIPIACAQNMKLYLKYQPKFRSSFRCRLNGNNGKAADRVIAISDGALCVKKDGKIWSLQGGALTFDSKPADAQWVAALEEQGLVKHEAEAQSIAARIWTAMLGLVCHPNYYKLGEQMAFVVRFSGTEASIYFASFPSDYLATVQNEGIEFLKTKFKDPIPLYHTAPCNLLDPDDRFQFCQDFIAVLRCLADGNASVGYLRRDGENIHKNSEGKDEERDEDVLWPPQEVLDATEEAEWREDQAHKYAP